MEFKFDQQKLEDQIVSHAVDEIYRGDDAIYNRIEKEVSARLDAAITKGLNGQIEKAINSIMAKALDAEVQPVNIWGERQGKPTTIRDALHERARAFWQEKVDKDGKVTSYGGVPRYEHVLSIITAKEFDAQIKQNIVNIAGAIKDAVRTDFYKQVDEKLNEFFKVSSAEDQKRKSPGVPR